MQKQEETIESISLNVFENSYREEYIECPFSGKIKAKEQFGEHVCKCLEATFLKCPICHKQVNLLRARNHLGLCEEILKDRVEEEN